MTFQRYTPPAGTEMKPDSKGQFYLASEVDKEIERLTKLYQEWSDKAHHATREGIKNERK